MQEIARGKSLDIELYRAACDLGNLNAAERSSTSYRKRVVRRRVLRTSNGVVQRGLRRFGLWR
ncbi:MAG: hypothetical protein ABSA14_12350 [Acidimicrobiales bacterium]|jgi:hypothetical protein